MIGIICILAVFIIIAIIASFVNKKSVPQAKNIKAIGKQPHAKDDNDIDIGKIVRKLEAEQNRYPSEGKYADWNLDSYGNFNDLDSIKKPLIGNLYRCGKAFDVDTTDMLPYDKNRIYRIFGNQIVKANQNGEDFTIYGIDLVKENDGKFSAKGFKKVDKGFIDPMGNTISFDFAKLVTVENNNLTTYGINATVSYDGNKIYFTLKGRDANKLVLLWGK